MEVGFTMLSRGNQIYALTHHHHHTEME